MFAAVSVIAVGLVAALSATSAFAETDVVWRYEARNYSDGEGDTLPYHMILCWVFRKAELLEWLFSQQRSAGQMARKRAPASR